MRETLHSMIFRRALPTGWEPETQPKMSEWTNGHQLCRTTEYVREQARAAQPHDIDAVMAHLEDPEFGDYWNDETKRIRWIYDGEAWWALIGEYWLREMIDWRKLFGP